MFVPLHDTNPLKKIRFQYVTVGLIALNVAIYVIFQTGWFIPLADEDVTAFAVVPAKLLASTGGGTAFFANGAVLVPERLTLVTYMFLHGGWLHLIGNMLFLWVFGDNIEDAMGHIRFIMFYLMCGIFAAMLHAYMLPHSDLPLIGASGAVAGVIAAYLILHPKVKVWVLALWRIPIKITAAWALGIWIAAQFVSLLFESEEAIAWWAHVGGLVAGAVLILFMRRRGVVLFDRTRGGA
ncbi:rhomboid family intramembrane serine protease [Methyloceanibacter superfactus]|uniref:Rhomboid family intramembrane serine protease n=1 Tax=Methyloceanibacter superfactus TaxID=1774969 RepID=A0A1E3VXN1_9HYPH|nr:rhomboid family intramembrane serine protease [Methyloceanibacter superfactus]ODR98298.1 rhomboid family intramembrane serine protease [Methyloceanibacter superfactus]